MFRVGDRVIKNPETWQPTDFDLWGRGIGIGIVVAVLGTESDGIVDVKWPAGKCYENVDGLRKDTDGD